MSSETLGSPSAPSATGGNSAAASRNRSDSSASGMIFFPPNLVIPHQQHEAESPSPSALNNNNNCHQSTVNSNSQSSNNNDSTSEGTTTDNNHEPNNNNGIESTVNSNLLSGNNGSTTTNDNNETAADDFPSHLICPIALEPPIEAVTFGVLNRNGSTHPQAFEYSALFRFISTTGVGIAVRRVRHPITRRKVRRDQALQLVKPVSPEIQQQINQERTCRNLTMNVENPIGQADHILYTQMLAIVHNP